MLKRWWEQWLGRLEYELEALRAAGIPYERDENLFRQGVLLLKVYPTVEGRTLNLLAVFPDVYPYTRFEIIAPDLNLPHHQNFLQKNLCLIGRSTENWTVRDTLAQYLVDRLPIVLKAALASDCDGAIALEEQQAEPISVFYPYLPGALVVMDQTDIGGGKNDRGQLVVGLSKDDPPFPLRGAILEVSEKEGKMRSTASPELSLLYPRRIRGGWVAIEEPIRTGDANEFLAALASSDPQLKRFSPTQVGNFLIDVVGVRFPEEDAWRRKGMGWLFLVRSKDMKGARNPKETIYFARAARASRADLGLRVPELSSLINKTIAIVGLGSLGAPSAVQFARAGIGELRLADPDIVELGTTVRWPLGFSAAGKLKADALREFIASNYPYTRVKASPHYVGTAMPEMDKRDATVLEDILDHADLVYDATAEVGIQFLLSEMAAERKIPYVCISSTPGSWGGLIARVTPEKPGCWGCIRRSLDDGSMALPPQSPASPVQPAGCADPTFTGAGFDLDQIAIAGVRLAVASLCRDAREGYPDFDWDVGIISLRHPDGRVKAPEWQTFPLHRHSSCDCGMR